MRVSPKIFVVSRVRPVMAVALLTLAMSSVALTGCKSAQDKALEQAKAQAASTGQAQQIVSTDKDGNTVTTIVQPPVPGQSGQVVTTTVTPKAGAVTTATAPTPQTTDQAATGQAATGQATTDQAAAGTAPAPAPAPSPKPNQAPVVSRAPQPPPPPINVAAGTTLVIRVDQTISAKNSQPGDKFTGEIVEPVTAGGQVVIPRKTAVGGEVVAAKGRGHFKGAADIELRLVSLTLDGKQYPLDTKDVLRTKKGKGKRTAAFIGGGGGLGMLIGGLAGGGKGALIGGLAGAGAGTAAGGLTGNRDLVIPAESIVRFKLSDDLEIDRD